MATGDPAFSAQRDACGYTVFVVTRGSPRFPSLLLSDETNAQWLADTIAETRRELIEWTR